MWTADPRPSHLRVSLSLKVDWELRELCGIFPRDEFLWLAPGFSLFRFTVWDTQENSNFSGSIISTVWYPKERSPASLQNIFIPARIISEMASLGSLLSPGWAREWSCFETGESNLVGTGEGTQHKDLSPDPQHLYKSCVEDVPQH